MMPERSAVGGDGLKTPAGAQALLAAQGITKSYGGTQALRGVNLEFRAGEVHAIAGENGAGKSTLTHILTGAVRADAGRIAMQGELVTLQGPSDGQRLGIRMVHQHDTLVAHLSVTENVLLGQLPRSRRSGLIDWAEARRCAQALLAQVGYPDFELRALAHTLSAAKRQIVEMAKALSLEPRVLILDEPSASLAQQDIERMFAFVRRLRDAGKAIVYITHRLDEIFELADRVTVLRDGAVTGSLAVADTDKASLVRLMVGRSIEDLFPRRSGGKARSALSVRNLAREGAFEQITFDVGEGQVVGMYGLVGSGRTELARCLFGADRISAGSITWLGRAFEARSPSDALARRHCVADRGPPGRRAGARPVGARQRRAGQPGGRQPLGPARSGAPAPSGRAAGARSGHPAHRHRARRGHAERR